MIINSTIPSTQSPSGGFSNQVFTNFTWGLSDSSSYLTFPGISSVPSTFYISFSNDTDLTDYKNWYQLFTTNSTPYINDILYLNGKTIQTYAAHNVSWGGAWVMSSSGGYANASSEKGDSVLTATVSGNILTVTLLYVPGINGYGFSSPTQVYFHKPSNNLPGWCIWY